jgi:hypothetical protein
MTATQPRKPRPTSAKKKASAKAEIEALANATEGPQLLV